MPAIYKIKGTIQLRGGTLAEWTESNPVLSDREMVLETDTRQFKIGDGVTEYLDLPYGGIKGENGQDGEDGEGSLTQADIDAAIASFAATTGSTKIGYASNVVGSLATTLFKKLEDLPLTSKADFGAKGFLGLPQAQWPDDTAAFQAQFASQYSTARDIKMPAGYFNIGKIYFGDPAQESYQSPSGSHIGVSQFSGAGPSISMFFARAEHFTNGGIMLRGNNFPGANFSDFAADGQGVADVCIDFSWKVDAQHVTAPSNQSSYRNITATNGKVLGINFDNVHDSQIENIRTSGSPRGISLVGGGGQLNMTNCAISGLASFAAQNLAISNSVFLSGVEINGSSDNKISFSGVQIFPIASHVSIPSYKTGQAINADDAGTYGCSLEFHTCFIFADGGSNPSCIQGRFGTGIFAKDCIFNYGTTLFGPIQAGNSPTKPIFEFDGCQFPSQGTPVGTNPSNYYWVMRNCYVGGVHIEYASNMTEGTWLPTGNNVALTVNSLSKWYRDGNKYTAFFDVTYPTTTNTDPCYIGGLPRAISSTAGSHVAYSISTYSTLLSGYVYGTQVIPIPAVGEPTAPTNEQMSGKRLSGMVTWSVTSPTNAT